jgi:hypothetical protein
MNEMRGENKKIQSTSHWSKKKRGKRKKRREKKEKRVIIISPGSLVA